MSKILERTARTKGGRKGVVFAWHCYDGPMTAYSDTDYARNLLFVADKSFRLIEWFVSWLTPSTPDNDWFVRSLSGEDEVTDGFGRILSNLTGLSTDQTAGVVYQGELAETETARRVGLAVARNGVASGSLATNRILSGVYPDTPDVFADVYACYALLPLGDDEYKELL